MAMPGDENILDWHEWQFFVVCGFVFVTFMGLKMRWFRAQLNFHSGRAEKKANSNGGVTGVGIRIRRNSSEFIAMEDAQVLPRPQQVIQLKSTLLQPPIRARTPEISYNNELNSPPALKTSKSVPDFNGAQSNGTIPRTNYGNISSSSEESIPQAIKTTQAKIETSKKGRAPSAPAPLPSVPPRLFSASPPLPASPPPPREDIKDNYIAPKPHRDYTEERTVFRFPSPELPQRVYENDSDNNDFEEPQKFEFVTKSAMRKASTASSSSSSEEDVYLTPRPYFADTKYSSNAASIFFSDNVPTSTAPRTVIRPNSKEDHNYDDSDDMESTTSV